MTAKQYFKYAFLSPLILPFIILGVDIVTGSFIDWQSSQLTGFLLATVFIGGIPYLIFLIGFYQWIKDKIGKQIHFFSYLFPVFYLLIFLICLAVYIPIVRPESFDGIFSFLISEHLWDAYFLFGKIAVVVAYLYIILINLGYWVLRIGNMFSGNSN